MSLIPGPSGPIDISFHESSTHQSPVVLLVPPHPHNEGDMSCPALTNFFRCFANMDFSVISFNYRGIGYSSGSFVEGQGEIADAAACLDWVRQKVDSEDFFWIMGYSFGAYVALQVLMRRPEVGRFIAVDADTTKDFSFLAPCPISGLFLQSIEKGAELGDATRGLISTLSLQSPSNFFERCNIPSPNAFSDCFFEKAQPIIQEYVASPDGRLSKKASFAA